MSEYEFHYFQGQQRIQREAILETVPSRKRGRARRAIETAERRATESRGQRIQIGTSRYEVKLVERQLFGLEHLEHQLKNK